MADLPASFPVFAPDRPGVPAEGGPLPYEFLAAVGISKEILELCCLKTAKVTRLDSFETVTIDFDGEEHADIPVWIHTDVGTRKQIIEMTPHVDINEYFKRSALIFPFKDTEVYVLVHTDPDTMQQTPLGVLNIKGNTASSPPPTYRAFFLFEGIFSQAGYGEPDYGGFSAKCLMLYDAVDDKIAVIPTVTAPGAAPELPFFEAITNYTDQRISRFLAAEAAIALSPLVVESMRLRGDAELVDISGPGGFIGPIDPTLPDVITGLSCVNGDAVNPGYGGSVSSGGYVGDVIGLACGASVSWTVSYSVPIHMETHWSYSTLIGFGRVPWVGNSADVTYNGGISTRTVYSYSGSYVNGAVDENISMSFSVSLDGESDSASFSYYNYEWWLASTTMNIAEEELENFLICKPYGLFQLFYDFRDGISFSSCGVVKKTAVSQLNNMKSAFARMFSYSFQGHKKFRIDFKSLHLLRYDLREDFLRLEEP